jgi:hypothetical protein
MEKVTGFCAYCYRHERADLADQMPPGGPALRRWLATHLPLDQDLMLAYRACARGHADWRSKRADGGKRGHAGNRRSF